MRDPIDIKALGYIDPSDYDTWYKVGIACKNAGVGFHVWDTWSSRDPKYGENSDGEMQRKWDSFTAQDLTWGTVVHFATANGYLPPQSERSDRRLQIDTTATESRKAALAAPSDVQNSLNADIVHAIDAPQGNKAQFTILPHATGTGKSTTMLTHSHNTGKEGYIATFQSQARDTADRDSEKYRFFCLPFQRARLQTLKKRHSHNYR